MYERVSDTAGKDQRERYCSTNRSEQDQIYTYLREASKVNNKKREA